MDLAEQVRQVANIIEIASQYTALKQRGSKHVGLCPFHSEKTPSFTVDADKQLYHCFGCGEGGDIFTLVMEKEDLSFPETVKYLAERYNIPIPETRRISQQQIKIEEKLYKITEDTLAFFRKNLFNTSEGKKALEYLKKRQITDDVIQELKIGYAMNSWDALLKYFQGKDISPDLLDKTGLVMRRQNREGYYDRFRGRIIFPIFTISGKAVAFGGRTIIDDDLKYLNSPDTPIYTKGKILYGLNFNKTSIREKKYSILVEGYTDFVALYQAGFRNCVASLGTALTSDQVGVIHRFSPRMLICYDADTAGRKAAARAVSICLEKGVHSKVMDMPEGKDPDSLIKESGVETFKKLLKNCIPGLKFFIDFRIQGIRMDIPEEKGKMVKEIMAIIDKIPDPVARDEYLKQTGQLLNVEEKIIRAMVTPKPATKKAPANLPLLNAEKRLLQIVFEDSDIAASVFKSVDLKYFKGLKTGPVFEFLAEFFKNGKTPDFKTIKENLDPTLISLLSRVWMETGAAPTLPEAEDCIHTIKQYAIEKEMKALDIQIARMEKNGDSDHLAPLLQQRQKVTEELTNQNYNK